MSTQNSVAPGERSAPAGRFRWLVNPKRPGVLLPLTGLWILVLDWLLFSPDALLLGMATPIVSGVGFLVGTAGAYFLQRKYTDDKRWIAALKAVGSGIVISVPWPLAGTVIGGWVLLVSGLRGFSRHSDQR